MYASLMNRAAMASATRKCCYPNCETRHQGNSDKGYFSWPCASNFSLFSSWENFVKSNHPSFVVPSGRKSGCRRFLCDLHFAQSDYKIFKDYKGNPRRRLVDCAVPSVHLNDLNQEFVTSFLPIVPTIPEPSSLNDLNKTSGHETRNTAASPNVNILRHGSILDDNDSATVPQPDSAVTNLTAEDSGRGISYPKAATRKCVDVEIKVEDNIDECLEENFQGNADIRVKVEDSVNKDLTDQINKKAKLPYIYLAKSVSYPEAVRENCGDVEIKVEDNIDECLEENFQDNVGADIRVKVEENVTKDLTDHINKDFNDGLVTDIKENVFEFVECIDEIDIEFNINEHVINKNMETTAEVEIKVDVDKDLSNNLGRDTKDNVTDSAKDRVGLIIQDNVHENLKEKDSSHVDEDSKEHAVFSCIQTRTSLKANLGTLLSPEAVVSGCWKRIGRIRGKKSLPENHSQAAIVHSSSVSSTDSLPKMPKLTEPCSSTGSRHQAVGLSVNAARVKNISSPTPGTSDSTFLSFGASIETEYKMPEANSNFFVCDLCQKESVQIRTPGGENRFSCQFCNNSFATAELPSKHIRTDTEDKPFKCSVCDERFVCQNSQKLHMSAHTEEYTHKCDFCPLIFPLSSQLTKHSRIHAVEIACDLTCDLCNKNFSTAGSFDEHIRIHNVGKPFYCSLCDKRFITRNRRDRHVEIHRREEPRVNHDGTHNARKLFSCNLCDKRFATWSSRGRHIESHKREKIRPPIRYASLGGSSVPRDSHDLTDRQRIYRHVPSALRRCTPKMSSGSPNDVDEGSDTGEISLFSETPPEELLLREEESPSPDWQKIFET